MKQNTKTKTFVCAVRQKDAADDAVVIEGVASTEHVDRHGDVVVQEGISLENFQKNPVLLLGHNSSKPPIGRVEKLWHGEHEGKKATFFRARFTRATAEGREVAQLFKEGIMSAISIGFRATDGEEKDGVFLFTKSELLEISAVSVPANQEALAAATEKGLCSAEVQRALITEPSEKTLDAPAEDAPEGKNLLEPSSDTTLRAYRKSVEKLRGIFGMQYADADEEKMLDQLIEAAKDLVGETNAKPLPQGDEAQKDVGQPDTPAAAENPQLVMTSAQLRHECGF